jgi:hypothetical protein
MAPTPLGAMSRRGARLGPASHVQTLRLLDTIATLFSLPPLIFATSAAPSVARLGAGRDPISTTATPR